MGVYFVLNQLEEIMIKVIRIENKRPIGMPESEWQTYLTCKDAEVNRHHAGAAAAYLLWQKYTENTNPLGRIDHRDYFGSSWEETQIKLSWHYLEYHEQVMIKTALLVLDYYLDDYYIQDADELAVEYRVNNNIVDLEDFKEAFNKINN